MSELRKFCRRLYWDWDEYAVLEFYARDEEEADRVARLARMALTFPQMPGEKGPTLVPSFVHESMSEGRCAARIMGHGAEDEYMEDRTNWWPDTPRGPVAPLNTRS